jgi:hypothetical protein
MPKIIINRINDSAHWYLRRILAGLDGITDFGQTVQTRLTRPFIAETIDTLWLALRVFMSFVAIGLAYFLLEFVEQSVISASITPIPSLNALPPLDSLPPLVCNVTLASKTSSCDIKPNIEGEDDQLSDMLDAVLLVQDGLNQIVNVNYASVLWRAMDSEYPFENLGRARNGKLLHAEVKDLQLKMRKVAHNLGDYITDSSMSIDAILNLSNHMVWVLTVARDKRRRVVVRPSKPSGESIREHLIWLGQIFGAGLREAVGAGGPALGPSDGAIIGRYLEHADMMQDDMEQLSSKGAGLMDQFHGLYDGLARIAALAWPDQPIAVGEPVLVKLAGQFEARLEAGDIARRVDYALGNATWFVGSMAPVMAQMDEWAKEVRCGFQHLVTGAALRWRMGPEELDRHLGRIQRSVDGIRQKRLAVKEALEMEGPEKALARLGVPWAIPAPARTWWGFIKGCVHL